MKMKKTYLPGVVDYSNYVLPFGEGLTNDMAEARNPAGKYPYKYIVETDYFYNSKSSDNNYYMVEYNNMKVCACVLTCGLNGFDFAMLWKQY
jgi:hypothetical protein